jgi:hypothetical protein
METMLKLEQGKEAKFEKEAKAKGVSVEAVKAEAAVAEVEAAVAEAVADVEAAVAELR